MIVFINCVLHCKSNSSFQLLINFGEISPLKIVTSTNSASPGSNGLVRAPHGGQGAKFEVLGNIFTDVNF